MHDGTWSGANAAALQRSMRLTNEAFAERLGVAVRTVANWSAKPEVVPRNEVQQLLDVCLEGANQSERARFATEIAGQRGNFGHHQDEQSRMSAALAVVVKEAEVLLVCRRDDATESIRWQFPAGVVKPAGDVSRTAVRETLKETGVRCRERKHLGGRKHPVTGVWCDYFLCDYLMGEPENLDPDENEDVSWVPLEILEEFIPLGMIYPPVLIELEMT